MRRISSRFTLLMLVALLCVSGAASVRAEGLFNDKALETAVRDVLKKKAEDPLAEADLKNVYILKAKGKGIKDLTGLDKCTNLAELNLAKNEIESIAPLAGLVNIQSLDLGKNKIADIAPVAKLVKLQYLVLESNQIESIDAVKDLKKLTSLYLAKNKIKSIAVLAEIPKLSSLYLDDNQVTDLSPLKNAKWVRLLGLRRNGIEDVSSLANMTELSFTFLQGNKLTDLSPLIEMAKKDAEGDKRFAPYWKLYLAENPLSDDAKTKQVEALKALGVRVNLDDAR
jgi:Leucine-rich repeat (LRR) protein